MSMHSCAVCVTNFITGGKFRLVSNFTELYALTPPVLMRIIVVRV